MERLWIGEVRRAARRANAPFARQVALGCGAAAVGSRWSPPFCLCHGMAQQRKPHGPRCGQSLDTSPSGLGSSSVASGGIE